jgi:hypothetical protein
MLLTYKAILQNNQLEWHDAAPENLPPQTPVEVYVTILEKQREGDEKTAVGQEMAQILQSLAELPERSIVEPLAWERETRADRQLPSRS